MPRDNNNISANGLTFLSNIIFFHYFIVYTKLPTVFGAKISDLCRSYTTTCGILKNLRRACLEVHAFWKLRNNK